MSLNGELKMIFSDFFRDYFIIYYQNEVGEGLRKSKYETNAKPIATNSYISSLSLSKQRSFAALYIPNLPF